LLNGTMGQLFASTQAEDPIETGSPTWGLGRSLGVLAIAAVALAIESETLTGALEPTAKRLGMTDTDDLGPGVALARRRDDGRRIRDPGRRPLLPARPEAGWVSGRRPTS
jgi:hypothetical protein